MHKFPLNIVIDLGIYLYYTNLEGCNSVSTSKDLLFLLATLGRVSKAIYKVQGSFTKLTKNKTFKKKISKRGICKFCLLKKLKALLEKLHQMGALESNAFFDYAHLLNISQLGQRLFLYCPGWYSLIPTG